MRRVMLALAALVASVPVALAAAPAVAAPAHAGVAWARACNGDVGLTPHLSLQKLSIPHHPNSSYIVGKAQATVGDCPPLDGHIAIGLERYYSRKMGGHPLGWVTLAGPVSRNVGGFNQGHVIKWPHFTHFCLPGRWRLHAIGKGLVAGDGSHPKLNECFPGGGKLWRCYTGPKGGLYIHDCG